MNRKADRNLIDALLQLVSRIKKEIADRKSKKQIYPGYRSYSYWEIKKYNYNERGPSYSSASVTKTVDRKFWHVSIIEIHNSIKKSDEYLRTSKLLAKSLLSGC